MTLALHDNSIRVALIDRALCGWRVQSDVALPELSPWDGVEYRPPDIVIQLGEIPRELEDAVDSGPFLQVAPHGTCRFDVAAVATYLVKDGRTIVVAPRVGADDSAVRLFLLGPVFDVLCHQRGELPLHVSAVEIDGQAVLFGGEPAAGKSVLAAELARRGHRVLADDVCAIGLSPTGAVVALPGAPRLILWGRSLAAFELTPIPTARVRPELERYSVRVDGVRGALPVRGVYHLHSDGEPGHLTPLAGMEAVLNLKASVRMPSLANRLRGEPGVFEMIARISASLTSHCRLCPGDDAHHIVRSANAVVAKHAVKS